MTSTAGCSLPSPGPHPAALSAGQERVHRGQRPGLPASPALGRRPQRPAAVKCDGTVSPGSGTQSCWVPGHHGRAPCPATATASRKACQPVRGARGGLAPSTALPSAQGRTPPPTAGPLHPRAGPGTSHSLSTSQPVQPRDLPPSAWWLSLQVLLLQPGRGSALAIGTRTQGEVAREGRQGLGLRGQRGPFPADLSHAQP